jgi:hypothetical protein
MYLKPVPLIANECEGCSLLDSLTNVRNCEPHHRNQCGINERKILVPSDTSIPVVQVVSYLDYELTDSIRKEIIQIIPDINQELLIKSCNLRNLIENLWKIQR